MPIVLVIKEKGDVHSVLLTGKPIILGRSGASDVRISDEKVSGKHLALKVNSQGRVMIKDLETTNGTLLNGANIDEAYLMISDKLTIGDVELSLDESQMGPKEKRPLIREDAPTQIKYIRMPPSDTATNKKLKKRQQEKQADSPTPAQEKDPPTVVFSDDKKKEKENKPAPGSEPKQDNKENKKKGRLVESAQKLSKNHEVDANANFGNEGQYEMEKPTGSTQMLKVSVEKQIKSSKPAAPKKTKKKPVKKEKKSLLQGLFQMFKGN